MMWEMGEWGDQDDVEQDLSNAVVVNKVQKRRKMRKIFGRSMKRGGNMKCGQGGDSLEYVPPMAAARVAEPVAVEAIRSSIKYIPKKNLWHWLQQKEVRYLALRQYLSGALNSHSILRLNVNLCRDRYFDIPLN